MTTQPGAPAAGVFESDVEDIRESTTTLVRFPQGRGGFLRQLDRDMRPATDDVSVPPQLRKDLNLRGGEMLVGEAENPSSRNPNGRRRMRQVQTVNGVPTRDYLKIAPIEQQAMAPLIRHLRVETQPGPLSTRVIDLLVPIGFGQRCLLIAPPRTGKTILNQQLAAGIQANYPDVHLSLLMIDERPEDVTDMRRSIHCEIIASCSDRCPDEHVRTGRLAVQRAKRLAETGSDVVLIIDSMTSLARAYYATAAGRELADSKVNPRHFVEALALFENARSLEKGGSLTIIASLVAESNSDLDQEILLALRSVANSEIVLTRELSEQKVWPAIDVFKSGTQHDDLMLTPEAVQTATRLRRNAEGEKPTVAMQGMLDTLRQYEINEDLVMRID